MLLGKCISVRAPLSEASVAARRQTGVCGLWAWRPGDQLDRYCRPRAHGPGLGPMDPPGGSEGGGEGEADPVRDNSEGEGNVEEVPNEEGIFEQDRMDEDNIDKESLDDENLDGENKDKQNLEEEKIDDENEEEENLDEDNAEDDTFEDAEVESILVGAAPPPSILLSLTGASRVALSPFTDLKVTIKSYVSPILWCF